MRTVAIALALLAPIAVELRGEGPSPPLSERVASSDIVAVTEVTGVVKSDGDFRIILSPKRVLLGEAKDDFSARIAGEDDYNRLKERFGPPEGGHSVVVFVLSTKEGLTLLGGPEGIEDWSEDLEKRLEPFCEAARQVRAIEGLARWESSAVGFAGVPGKGYTKLETILDLKEDALPFLGLLVASKAPVARIAGLVGYRVGRFDDGARRAIELLADETGAECAEGCLIGERKVSEYAAETFDASPEAARDEALVGALEGAEGPLREEALRRLRQAAGEDLGDEPAQWREWLKTRRR